VLTPANVAKDLPMPRRTAVAVPIIAAYGDAAGDGQIVEQMGHVPWGPLAPCPGSADPNATGVSI